MIQVDRNRLVDGEPVAPGPDWFLRALRETSILVSKPTSFKDDLYGHQEVRNALLELFHNKCAYCEFCIEDCDVEHYRPKARVAEDTSHPGYYWLAYQWLNLYPACPACNRSLLERGTHGDSRLGANMGKACAFPLLDEATRVKDHSGDVAGESRALLDPCQDDPEEHLDFNLMGEIFAKPHSLMAQPSIDAYALKRRRLVKLRKDHLRRVKKALQALPTLEAKLIQLRHFQNCDEKFAGFVRAVSLSLDLENTLKD